MNFSEELKTARISVGWTQKMLSDKFEIPKRTIEDWERGIRVPPSYVQKLLLKEMLREKRKPPVKAK